MVLNRTYAQNVTLFDHVYDDEFDGTFGQDDDEKPFLQFRCTLTQFEYKTDSEPEEEMLIDTTVNNNPQKNLQENGAFDDIESDTDDFSN